MNPLPGAPFDAAPFARPYDREQGLVWEDPREIHEVVVHFASVPPPNLRLQYWRTRWPEQRLPKDQVPGGGSVGWWELGNWYTGQWQTADTECTTEGNQARFRFRPLCENEIPEATDFPATFRTTLKLRVEPADGVPPVEHVEAYTDSVWERALVTVLFAEAPAQEPVFDVYNGVLECAHCAAPCRYVVSLWRTRNSDPNSFDRTLLTVCGREVATVAVEDLARGPLYVKDRGVCFVEGEDLRDLTAVAAEALAGRPQGICDLVTELPEQTWKRAWANMVPKHRQVYLPLAADGGRHKFGVNPDGSVFYRTNNHLLTNCPGRDTPALAEDVDRLTLSFGLPEHPAARTRENGVLPIGITTWRLDECGNPCQEGNIQIEQLAFVTVLGADLSDEPPPADATGVLVSRFRLSNLGDKPLTGRLMLRCSSHDQVESIHMDERGLVWAGEKLRACVDTGGAGQWRQEELGLELEVPLARQGQQDVVVKVPYVVAEAGEVEALLALDWETEHRAVVNYWRRRMARSMKLHIPEPALSEFHAAHASHLLINCEREPGSTRRFARVGSFSYAAFGNESCMMIVELDRRGYHQEAQECLEAFLHYQGTVPLPGDFSSHEGVLYGARGYEHGGYNQHHGWILWCLVEHYRFTRDNAWLARIAPHMLAAADWIIRERARTAQRDDLGRGLLPHGSLEDIGDWWQWLSTNCYTWRGLDAAAWGLEQLAAQERTWTEDAHRLRQEAEDYRAAILRAFTEAAQRSPVVRLRHGVAVPHFPAHVHRRGRSFGWICETLEGAIHLLIAGVLPADSREAEWILRDYEDNLHLSGTYGYWTDEYAARWFDWGGFCQQACLLLDVEPYLYRDQVKHALRAAFNAIAANYHDDVRMIVEHALPDLGDWRGDHYKTSDEANAAGWLRYLFVREQGEELLLGQAVPRDWLRPGCRVGVEDAATHFGPLTLIYEAGEDAITARLEGPRRNPPSRIRLRFRAPEGRAITAVEVNDAPWQSWDANWVTLPGNLGTAEVKAMLEPRG